MSLAGVQPLDLVHGRGSSPTADNVHGIVGPNLPDANGKPGSEQAVDILDGYHQLLGVWKSK